MRIYLVFVMVTPQIIYFKIFKVMKDSSKSVWRIALTIVKYVVTVALGYLAGDSDVINNLIQ